MTFVIQEACVGVKDTTCVEVCPVDAIVPEEHAEEKWLNANITLSEEHDDNAK